MMAVMVNRRLQLLLWTLLLLGLTLQRLLMIMAMVTVMTNRRRHHAR
jgi:hypothetical protein